jgi:3-hydroxy-9,10-secoandrosta-1,3,5(10)-triene-9,17-dione monooxygenase
MALSTAAAENPPAVEEDDDRLAFVMEMKPRLRARAAQAESLGRVPPESMEELQKAGIFRGHQPVRLGGRPMSRQIWQRIVFEIARECGSTGWVCEVLAGHAAAVSAGSPELQDEVWGDDYSALVSSSVGQPAKAVRVEGGYRLSGQLPFSSGCDYASWAMIGGRETGPDSQPQFFFVPIKEFTILHDSWRTLGMAGTGSKTLVAEDIFVPDWRVGPAPRLAGTVGLGLLRPLVGMAQGAVDAFIEHARSRVGRGERESDWQHTQFLISEAQAEVDAAWLLLTRASDELAGHHVMQVPGELRARIQRDQSFAAKLCIQATQRLFNAGGGSVIHMHNRLRRAFADTQGAALHRSNNWASNARAYGAVTLGFDYIPEY